jgi:hypothetical protein
MLVPLLARPALGLVTLNDGTDTIFVTGGYSMGYSTNIGASSENIADSTYVASLALEYHRRAGLTPRPIPSNSTNRPGA